MLIFFSTLFFLNFCLYCLGRTRLRSACFDLRRKGAAKEGRGHFWGVGVGDVAMQAYADPGFDGNNIK